MEKVVRIGTAKTYGGRSYSIYCKIEYKDGKLSITGVEGPTSGGNALGSCGQIVMHEWDVATYAPGWNKELEEKFRTVWERWHLNNMRAGTPAQSAHLRNIKDRYPGYPKSHYEWALEELGKVGLNSDNGYKYGSAWLKEEVPQSVIDFLWSLPDSDKTPAWI